MLPREEGTERMSKRVTFVRLIRMKGMKFGFAVDVAGKTWRGFYANRSEAEVYYSAHLGTVGVCLMCRGRVYEGWECLNDKRDVCAGCVILPTPEKTFIMDVATEEVWDATIKEFIRNANFDHVRGHQSAHRPCERHHEPK